MAATTTKPWQDPTKPEGVPCPRCKAPPGSQCRASSGFHLGEAFHEARRKVAERNAQEARRA